MHDFQPFGLAAPKIGPHSTESAAPAQTPFITYLSNGLESWVHLRFGVLLSSRSRYRSDSPEAVELILVESHK
jgi:hypothetical protein